MTEIEIYKQVVQKQDEYNNYILRALKSSGILWYITEGVREYHEKKLTSLRQQLEKAQEDNPFPNRPNPQDVNPYDLSRARRKRKF